MTGRERLLTVLAGGIPDCVPASPDISNMVPCKLTGKPYWRIYLYNDPPLHEAHIAATRYFDLDVYLDGFAPLVFPEERTGPAWEPFIIQRQPDRIVVQYSHVEDGQRVWSERATVYRIADPPVEIDIAKLHLPPTPATFEPVEGIKPVDASPEGFARVKAAIGERGLLGAFLTTSLAVKNEQDIYRYYDHPEQHEEWAARRVEAMEKRFARIMQMKVKPDFLCVGGSGTMVFQNVEMFRKVAFPAVKRAIELATAAGFPTQIHSCGPEKNLIKIMAEETTLTAIDPLEVRPMGDCDLAEIKKLYGRKLVLKGNLHTTDVMLRGTAADVVRASKAAIDAAAAGGRFILSTGDQCGRDTPFENIFALIDTARTYGRY